MRTAGIPFLIMLWPVVIILIKKSWRERAGVWFAQRPHDLYLIGALLTVFNLVFVLFDEKAEFGKAWFGVYITVPTAALFYRRRKPIDRIDFLIVVWLWVPVQLRWIHPSWGGGETAHVLVNFSVVILLLSGLFAARGIDPNLDWRFNRKDGVWILGALLFLIPAVVWPAWVVKFVDPHLNKNWRDFPFAWLEIWFTTALFEELVFRGVVQKITVRYLKPYAGILLASAIFGFYHITRTAGFRHYPNWWYVLFASIAGLAYGIVCHKRNLQAAIMTHCCVDFIWWLLLKAGK